MRFFNSGSPSANGSSKPRRRDRRWNAPSPGLRPQSSRCCKPDSESSRLIKVMQKRSGLGLHSRKCWLADQHDMRSPGVTESPRLNVVDLAGSERVTWPDESEWFDPFCGCQTVLVCPWFDILKWISTALHSTLIHFGRGQEVRLRRHAISGSHQHQSQFIGLWDARQGDFLPESWSKRRWYARDRNISVHWNIALLDWGMW